MNLLFLNFYRALVNPHILLRWIVFIARLSLGLALISLPYALFLSLNSPPEVLQGESVLYLYLHVPAALSCFMLYGLMSAGAVSYFIWRLKAAHLLSISCLAPCLFMASITLLTGSLWGKSTWGTYWIWDARLTSFLFLTLYLGLLLVLQGHPQLQKSPRGRQLISGLILVGALDVIFVHQSVIWFKTLHQPPSLTLSQAPTLDRDFLLPLMVSTVAFFASSIGVSLSSLSQALSLALEPRQKRDFL